MEELTNCAVCGKPFHRVVKHQLCCSRKCSLIRNSEIIEIIKQKNIKKN